MTYFQLWFCRNVSKNMGTLIFTKMFWRKNYIDQRIYKIVFIQWIIQVELVDRNVHDIAFFVLLSVIRYGEIFILLFSMRRQQNRNSFGPFSFQIFFVLVDEDFQFFIEIKGAFKGYRAVVLKASHAGKKNADLTISNHTQKDKEGNIVYLPIYQFNPAPQLEL